MKDKKKTVRLHIKTTTDSNYKEFVDDMKLALTVVEGILEKGYVHLYKENGLECFKAYPPSAIRQVNGVEVE